MECQWQEFRSQNGLVAMCAQQMGTPFYTLDDLCLVMVMVQLGVRE